MKPDKLKLSFDFDSANALANYLNAVLSLPPFDDEERLHHAVLCEILEKLLPLLVFVQKKYSIKITPAQSIALRNTYMQTKINGTHFNTKMLMLCNQIHQQYFL
jgi:hypothetical protein